MAQESPAAHQQEQGLEWVCTSATSARRRLPFQLQVNVTAVPSSISLCLLGTEIQAPSPAAIIVMITFFLCLIVLLSGTGSS